MEQKIVLKPCPFCGAEASVEPSYIEEYDEDTYVIECEHDPDCILAVMEFCSSEAEHLQKIWNRRAGT